MDCNRFLARNFHTLHTKNMNSYMHVNRLEEDKADHVAKYNLRCIRNVSEKMTKKDFIYDMRSPLLCPRKVDERKQDTVLLHLRKKTNLEKSSSTVTSQIPVNCCYSNAGTDTNLLGNRVLNYRCNFCNEAMATLFSLATHVKSHYQQYCKKCYWILVENETMEQHLKNFHDLTTTI